MSLVAEVRELVAAARPGALIVLPPTDLARLCDRVEALERALRELLPVAEAFEKQASKGTGGRRGGAVFARARAVLGETPP